ncbi:MAG: ribosome recycling factor [Clostridia bacterium]
MDVYDLSKDKMQKTIAALQRDLATLRAGRASASVLDRIMVDCYGTPTAINSIANISSPEPRLLVISPWDPSIISNIEKAIQKSDLGINPSTDGKLIRLIFPELTEERRKDLVKVVKKKGEDAKVAIRSIRRDAMEQYKKQRKASELTEDDQKQEEEKTQKLTDEMINDIEIILSSKEKEIMDV